MSMKKLVVNADDFGKSERTNERIKSSVIEGAVTSTSVMGNIEKTSDLDTIETEDIGWGVHLNVTEGKPVRDDLQTLVDDSGSFLGFKRFLLSYFAGKIRLSEIEKEFEAQIEKADNLIERKPDHLNSHHHVHMLPRVYKIVERKAENRDINHLRCSKEVIPLESAYIRKSFNIENLSRAAVSALMRCGLRSSSDFSFTGIINMGEWDVEKMNAFLSSNKREKTELCVHPEYECDLRAVTDSSVLRKMSADYKMTDFR